MPSVATRRWDTKAPSTLKRNTPGRWPIEQPHTCPPQGVHSNPVQNPWVKGDRVDPAAGRPFDSVAKRQAAHDAGQQGIILAADAVTSAFKSRRNDRNEPVQRNGREGWVWGGDWSSLKDYQHFSENGR